MDNVETILEWYKEIDRALDLLIKGVTERVILRSKSTLGLTRTVTISRRQDGGFFVTTEVDRDVPNIPIGENRIGLK